MYFFNSLDRSNLGNAKTDGIEDDLHLIGNQYTVILAVFNATFSLFDLPSNLLLKRFTGKVTLPVMMIGWYVWSILCIILVHLFPYGLADDYCRGSVTLLQCAAFDFAGILVCRLFMGIFEAGFFGMRYHSLRIWKLN